VNYIKEYMRETEHSENKLDLLNRKILRAYLKNEMTIERVPRLRSAIYEAISLHNKKVFCNTPLPDGELCRPEHSYQGFVKLTNQLAKNPVPQKAGFINLLDELDALHSYLEDHNLIKKD
jgi:hypothetical protein